MPTTGPQQGSTGTLGSATITGGVATLTMALPVMVTEFRTSGPGGANDSYTESNNGAPVPLAGFVVTSSSGTPVTLPADAGMLDIYG